MLNSGWNSNYKNLAKKAELRECKLSEAAISELVVDFRSRLFRYMRLAYTNRTLRERAASVFRTMKDLRTVGEVVTEKHRVFDAALFAAKRETSAFGTKCTYVFGSPEGCPYKARLIAKNAQKRTDRLEELKRRVHAYRQDMFNLEAMEHCALALESYIISDLEGVSALYAGKEWALGVPKYAVPDESDSFESDRLCARLAKTRGAAVLSEDYDCVALFGADMMVMEVFKNFFVYASLRDVMATFESERQTRKDVVHRCCVMGTDYNLGLKGVGPVKVKKIDVRQAKELFETCLAAQHTKPTVLYSFFFV